MSRETGRETGHVKWFSNEKGYGFIERDGREDVFVHHSQISMEGFRTLDAGEPVEFEIISGERGPKAQNVLRTGAGAGPTNGDSSPGHGDGTSSHGRSSPSIPFVSRLANKLFGRLTNRH